MNVALQTATPSHTHRLCVLLNHRTNAILPSRLYGHQARKLDECLVFLEDVQVERQVFMEWHKNSVLYRHIRRIYWLDPACEVPSLTSLYARVEGSLTEFHSLKILCFPRRLEKEIATGLSLDVPLNPKTSSHVLSVVQHGCMYLFGITPRQHNFFQLCTEPKAFDDFSSAAVNKLDEAFRCLHLPQPSGQIVVDLGAAPGGWTKYLAQSALWIYAVDGAKLAEDVTALQHVTHLPFVADKAIEELKNQLSRRNHSVDLLVSDMNVTPFTLIDVLKTYQCIARPGCRIIATLKFIGTRNDRDAQLLDLQQILEEQGWVHVQFLWLMANTKSERMLTALSGTENALPGPCWLHHSLIS